MNQFRVYKNLRFISHYDKDNLPSFHREHTPVEDELLRLDWLKNRALRFYSPDEVEEILENRRSDGSPQAVVNDFMKAEQPIHHIPKDEYYYEALRLVTEHFKPNRVLHPVSYPDLRHYDWNLPISAEAPWNLPKFRFRPDGRSPDLETDRPRVTPFKVVLPKLDKPIDVKSYLRYKQKLKLVDNDHLTFHNLYNEIFMYNRVLIHLIKDKKEPFWKGNIPVPYAHLTMHLRTHVVHKSEPDKVRAVFGAPKLLLQAELMFIWPMQSSYLNGNCGRMLWGREMNRGGWRRLFSEIHNHGRVNTVIGIDWSGFDRKLLHELISDVHAIWRSYFDFTTYEHTSEYPSPMTNPERIENLWNWMCAAIRRTPILLPNGELWEWRFNGFGSGFQQTQLMDTFANAVMVYTCLLAMGINVNAKHFFSKFQGDDSLIAFLENMCYLYGAHFLEMLAECAKHYFNATLNLKKSMIQDKVSGMYVLGYFNVYGFPFRSEADLLRHLFFPERPQHFGALAASAVGLAYASFGNHERFYELCKYIFEKLTKKENLGLVKIQWWRLKWMVRTGMFDTLDQLKNSDFPSRHTVISLGYAIRDRDHYQRQLSWPINDYSDRRFYFINDV